jgi:hypothetical protein
MITAIKYLIYILQGSTLAEDQEKARATGDKLLAWTVADTAVTLGDVVYTICGKGDFQDRWFYEPHDAWWVVNPRGDLFVEGTRVPIDPDLLSQPPTTVVDTVLGEAYVYAIRMA